MITIICFEGRVLVLIVLKPGHCLLFTFGNGVPIYLACPVGDFNVWAVSGLSAGRLATRSNQNTVHNVY